MAVPTERTVVTKVLILSDTHGMKFGPSWPAPKGDFDLIIHCGDLTAESKLHEFSNTLDMLRAINSPLKLVIAGNHDLTLDDDTFQKHLSSSKLSCDDSVVIKEYGKQGEALEMMKSAASDGIIFLEEGTHEFTLPCGARLKVYASPYTPRKAGEGSLGSSEAGWAFQYESDSSNSSSTGHDYKVEPDTDIVITHGPPHGLLDYVDRRRAGCQDLFTAIEKSRPQLHCFGHIHSGWGAKLVGWRLDHHHNSEPRTHFTAINNDNSEQLENLARLKPGRFDDETTAKGKEDRLSDMIAEGYCFVKREIKDQSETMFVNASIEGSIDIPVQPPIMVELKLRKA